MPWNGEKTEILVNRENIEDAFKYINQTKKRVKKLERLTSGVNSMNKNYNYDDSIKRLYDITNEQARRLDRIEERLDGSRVSDYSRRGNRRHRILRGGRRTRRRRRKKSTRKRRKSMRRKKRRKKRTKRRKKRR